MRRHWQVRGILENGFCHVISPTMLADPDGTNIFTNFSEKRQLYEQFKKMEVVLRKHNIHGWIVSTEIDRPNIMLLIAKCGGEPFKIDLKSNQIWFQKTL